MIPMRMLGGGGRGIFGFDGPSTTPADLRFLLWVGVPIAPVAYWMGPWLWAALQLIPSPRKPPFPAQLEPSPPPLPEGSDPVRAVGGHSQPGGHWPAGGFGLGAAQSSG